MQLSDQITMDNDTLAKLGADAMQLFVSGLDANSHAVICAYMGTLMFMILQEVQHNAGAVAADAVLASVVDQWNKRQERERVRL